MPRRTAPKPKTQDPVPVTAQRDLFSTVLHVLQTILLWTVVSVVLLIVFSGPRGSNNVTDRSIEQQTEDCTDGLAPFHSRDGSDNTGCSIEQRTSDDPDDLELFMNVNMPSSAYFVANEHGVKMYDSVKDAWFIWNAGETEPSHCTSGVYIVKDLINNKVMITLGETQVGRRLDSNGALAAQQRP